MTADPASGRRSLLVPRTAQARWLDCRRASRGSVERRRWGGSPPDLRLGGDRSLRPPYPFRPKAGPRREMRRGSVCNWSESTRDNRDGRAYVARWGRASGPSSYLKSWVGASGPLIRWARFRELARQSATGVDSSAGTPMLAWELGFREQGRWGRLPQLSSGVTASAPARSTFPPSLGPSALQGVGGPLLLPDSGAGQV
jgi:hypothetical protein